ALPGGFRGRVRLRAADRGGEPDRLLGGRVRQLVRDGEDEAAHRWEVFVDADDRVDSGGAGGGHGHRDRAGVRWTRIAGDDGEPDPVGLFREGGLRGGGDTADVWGREFAEAGGG